MHNVTRENLWSLGEAYGQENITLQPIFDGYTYGYEGSFRLDEFSKDEHSGAVFEVKVRLDHIQAQNWDWMFGTTVDIHPLE